MKNLKNLRINMILWYAISGMWTVALIGRLLEEEKSYALLGTAFTLLASLSCAIIDHYRYLKEKKAPTEENTPDTEA